MNKKISSLKLSRIDVPEEADQSKVIELQDVLNKMDSDTRSKFMLDSLLNNLTEGKHLKQVSENPEKPLLVEEKPELFPIDIPEDRPVINDDIEMMRSFYGLRNNEIKEIFGISDTKITKMKKDPEGVMDDAAVALTVRFYAKYPELLEKELKGEYSLKSIVDWLGGIERHVGVLIGRNHFSGYRYIKKKQKGSTSVKTIKSILTHFLKEERMTEYYEVIDTESKARGIKDIYEHGKWD